MAHGNTSAPAVHNSAGTVKQRVGAFDLLWDAIFLGKGVVKPFTHVVEETSLQHAPFRLTTAITSTRTRWSLRGSEQADSIMKVQL